MIVEKTAFETTGGGIESTSTAQRGVRTNRRGVGEKKGAEYAAAHGVKRGQHSGKFDTMTRLDEPSEIPRDAAKEGLHLYIQTTVCRRRLIANVFENSDPSELLLITKCSQCAFTDLDSQLHPLLIVATSATPNCLIRHVQGNR